MYTAYAWKPAQDTPLMRKQVHRLCVEISRDSHRNVDMPDERLQLFRLDFPGAGGGMAATANLRSPDSECQQGRANRGVDSFKRDGGSSPKGPFLVRSRWPEFTIGSNENCLGCPEKDQRP